MRVTARGRKSRRAPRSHRCTLRQPSFATTAIAAIAVFRSSTVWAGARIDPGTERFVDGALGEQAQDPSRQCGDVLIRDRVGNWTYQFVAAVDDFRQEIDLVIRGVDLLDSTGRQIRIAGLLGRATPAQFRHHSLVMKAPGQKLSKSDGDTGVRDLRALGWTAQQLRQRVQSLILHP